MHTWDKWVIGALGLALLMVVHESGHFFAARAFGMRVTRFSIGFGPPLFKILPADGYFWFTTAGERLRIRLGKHDPEKHGPTIYQVALIPFLAYVQIAGMNPLEEIDPEDKGSYANASLIGRITAIFAGPLANYLFASVLFFGSLMIGGKLFLGTEVSTIEGRPAAAAGMQTGDKVLEVSGIPVEEWSKMAEIISSHPAEPVPIVVQRGSERVTLTVTPANEGGKGKIGVQLAPTAERRVPVSLKEASKLAVIKPAEVVRDLVVDLTAWVTGKAEGEVGGPVAIARAAAARAHSLTELLAFLGVLSAYLGAFNLIPFPALDGGRLMFLGYEAATRRRPNAKIEAQIHMVGLVMMLSLMLYITVMKDLRLGSK